jgi:hypothetical protein
MFTRMNSSNEYIYEENMNINFAFFSFDFNKLMSDRKGGKIKSKIIYKKTIIQLFKANASKYQKGLQTQLFVLKIYYGVKRRTHCITFGQFSTNCIKSNKKDASEWSAFLLLQYERIFYQIWGFSPFFILFLFFNMYWKQVMILQKT